MYTLNYYVTKREGSKVYETEYASNSKFRLRRDALHYLWEIIQKDYKKSGYATSRFVGGLYCIKSEKTDKDERIVTEISIKIDLV